MAKRRMFSLDVVDTDSFLDLPASSQSLYFHLGMRADDDGFVSSPKRITAMVGAAGDAPFWNTSFFPLRQTLARSSRTILRKPNNPFSQRRFFTPTTRRKETPLFYVLCYAVGA